MLVLERRAGQSLIVTLPDGRGFTIKAVEINNKRIKIGIEAPDDVKVVREELLEQKGRDAQ